MAAAEAKQFKFVPNLKKQQDLDQVPEPSFKYVDLDSEKKELAVYTAKLAYLAKAKGDILYWKDAAEMIKKEFDEKLGPTWHCIVGSHFGSFVTHESKNLVYFFIGHMGVLLFKHG
eukprot:TRINITY_DN699_c0_g3_i1.p1 TRINITY_DN699_c0_g3~~TRINITY_DN699_c0_g3_i1.p1  ORF type:complete len:116 (+),score=9.80 TRINITY_DN699_c0_g3_i1:91-438(+)